MLRALAFSVVINESGTLQESLLEIGNRSAETFKTEIGQQHILARDITSGQVRMPPCKFGLTSHLYHMMGHPRSVRHSHTLSRRGGADVWYGVLLTVLGIGSLNDVEKYSTLLFWHGKPLHKKKKLRS